MKETMNKQSLLKLHAVARVTFLEILKDKILYSAGIVSLFLFVFTFFISKLSVVSVDRVILDFGMSVINLSMSFIALFFGATLISREFERKTVYLILSRPMSWSSFLFGKFLGLIYILFLEGVLFSLFLILMLSFFKIPISSMLGFALMGIFFQSFILAGMALFFNTFTTTSLSVVFGLFFYFFGNNVSQIRLFIAKLESDSLGSILSGFVYIIPNFESLSWKTNILYQIGPEWSRVMITLLYSLSLIFTLILAASFISKRKN